MSAKTPKTAMAVCLLLALSSAVRAGAVETEIEGWKLTQRGRLTGNIDVFFCRSAVKIVIPKNGLTVVCSAPWKEASYFCKGTGAVFSTPFDKVSNPYVKAMALCGGGELSEIKVVASGPAKSIGLTCREYAEDPQLIKGIRAACKAGEISGRAPTKIAYLLASDLPVDPHIGRLMARFFALPQAEGIPLQFNYDSMTDHKCIELASYACKQAKLKPSDFTVPKGLKTVSDACKVLVPDNSDEALDMMMGQSKLK